jgi:hypothetical protein
MNDERSIAAAREALGVGLGVVARTWPVRRFDRPGESYMLVVLGDEGASVGVAAVDAGTGRVLAHAALPGTGAHWVIAEDEAVARAGAAAGAHAALVWAPSMASRSMFYPLWQVEGPEGAVFVDFSGSVWPDLVPGGPGGGGGPIPPPARRRTGAG